MELTKISVARTLGSEPTWEEGKEITFTFTYNNRTQWEITLRREEAIYEPFKYGLWGKVLLWEGVPIEYHMTHSRRYPTMEAAFLHIVNHFNDNANIENKYKTIDQWLNESKENVFIAA